MRGNYRLIPRFALVFGVGVLLSFLLPASTLLIVSTLVFVAALFATVRGQR